MQELGYWLDIFIVSIVKINNIHISVDYRTIETQRPKTKDSKTKYLKTWILTVNESTFGDDSRSSYNFRIIPENRNESLEMLYEKRIRFIDHLSTSCVNDS